MDGIIKTRAFRRIAVPALACALFLGPCLSAGADCARRAVVTKATTNDPFFTKDGGKNLLASVHAFLGGVLTTANFHFVDKEIVENNAPRSKNPLGNYHPPEYSFKVNWQIGLNEPRKGDRPVVSRLTVSVYYNGDSEELVKSWSTAHDYPHYEAHVNLMFRNSNSVLNKARPIEEILWDFERTPVTCKVEVKGEKPLKRGEEVDIVLSEFKDDQGRASKPFNRIVLQSRDGKILNGTPLEADKDKKAFRIGDGPLTVKYKAPEDPGVSEDVFRINNSCEILPESQYPMAKTELAGVIEEERIPIKTALVAQIVETSSGMCDDGSDDGYPFSYTVSMSFEAPRGGSPSDPALFGEAADTVRSMTTRMKMPRVIAELPGSNDARLVAELFPVESSMSVKAWRCTDPEYNTPPPARFPGGKERDSTASAAAQMWIIGDTLYIVNGFLGGILGYYPTWDDEGIPGEHKQPLGARVEGTWGDMGKYLEIPLASCKDGQTVSLSKSHSGDDGDAWSWRTTWTISIAF